MVGATSFSTKPSVCAERKMDCRLREIPFRVEAISLRILARVGEALSLILPNLSMIVSIDSTRRGKTMISPARAVRAG